MNIGTLQAASGRLHEALEKLQLVWTETSEVWRDANSRQLEEQHLRPIAEGVGAALPAIGQLAQVLQAAARELEER